MVMVSVNLPRTATIFVNLSQGQVWHTKTNVWIMNRGQSQNQSDSGANIINMVSIGAGATFYKARDRSFLTFGQLHSVAGFLVSRAIRVAQLFGRSTQLRSIRSDREIFPFPFSASGSSYTRVHGIVANILINSKICQSSKTRAHFSLSKICPAESV